MADTHIDPHRLDQYRTVYVQAVDFMDPADQEALIGYVEDGGTLVIGPTLPTRDPTMRRTEVFGRFLDAPGRTQMGNGELIWADHEGLTDIVDDLSPVSSIRLASGPGDLAVFQRGDETLVFVANPTGCTIDATILSSNTPPLPRPFDEYVLLPCPGRRSRARSRRWVGCRGRPSPWCRGGARRTSSGGSGT